MSEENKEKSALVPRLRFQEFREDWKLVTVSDFFDLTDKAEKATIFEKDKVLTVKLHTNGVVKNDKTTLTGGANYFNRRAGQFIFSKIDLLNGAFGVVPITLDGFSSSSDVPAYSFNAEQSPTFFVNWLKANYERLEIERTGTSSTLKRVSPEKFLALAVSAPTPTEQQKIADCLSSLDELITAETQKLDALKTHKKGLMQQLFPREGETAPRLRFPEFQEAGEWEEVTLGEIAEIKLGKMLDSKKHTTGNLLPYLNNLAVRWNEVDTSNLPKMYFDDDELDRFGLRAGDVVVCEGGEPGRSAVWDGCLPDLKFQKAVHRVRFKVPFDPRLLVLYLESIAGTPQLEHLFTGGGIKHLTQEVFARLKIPFTCHAEQQRISGCLAALDNLITAQSQKIDALKTHKKGLMQQLFPVLDEVPA